MRFGDMWNSLEMYLSDTKEFLYGSASNVVGKSNRYKSKIGLGIAAGALALAVACGGQATPYRFTPTLTPTPTLAPTPWPTATAVPTPAPVRPIATPTPVIPLQRATSTPTPQPTPQPTPTTIIQLQRQSEPTPVTTPTLTPTPTPAPPPVATPAPIPRSATTPTATATPRAIPTPSPTPQKLRILKDNGKSPKAVTIYFNFSRDILDASLKTGLHSGYTKLLAYSWKDGLNVTLTSQENFTQVFEDGKYNGVLIDISSTNKLKDSDIFAIAEFIKRGKRAFIEIGDDSCRDSDFVASFENYLSISMACEDIKENSKLYNLTPNLLPWAEELVAKVEPYQSFNLEAFFVERGGYRTGTIISEGSKTARAVTAYGMLGNGEIFLIILPYQSLSLLSDRQIDKYQNRLATINILKWLSGTIDVYGN